MSLTLKSRIFGYPLFTGKGKKRVILKYLRKKWKGWDSWWKQFESYKVGDVVNDCSSYNGVIKEMTPEYFPPFDGASFEVLWDVELQTTSTGASLRNCGIEPALPREEVVRRLQEFYTTRPEWRDHNIGTGKEVGPNGEMVPPNNL